MSLPQFKDEAEFRKTFIAPLLSKLGYALVTHIHGSGEQGKDFFFAEYDRFEHRRFLAVQAKLGDIGAGQVETDKLLNQVKRSFTVKLRHHGDVHDQRISAVYVMASGTISQQAREYISDWCHGESFGANVHFLDGDRLERLDRFSTFRTEQNARNRLIGLGAEAIWNGPILDAQMACLQNNQFSIERCRHTAIDAMLCDPLPQDILAPGMLINAASKVSQANKIAELSAILPNMSLAEWIERIPELMEAKAACETLERACIQALHELDQRFSINVQVVPIEPPTEH